MTPARPSIAFPALALLVACSGPQAASRPPAQPEREASAAPAPAAAAPAQKAAAKPAGAPAAAPAPEVPQLSPRAQRLFDEAVATYEEQRKQKAPVDWESQERKWRLVTETQDVPEAWFNMGVAQERQGRASEAASAYRRAVALRPSLGEAAVNLAILEEPAEDPRAAARQYAELARRHPDDAQARVRLASLYRASGQLDEAWRLAREALQRDPKVAGAHKVMMRVALERGNADLAELLALRAQKLDPEDPELAFFLGEGLARRGDAAAAAVQYRKALALRPGYLPARYGLLRQALAAQAWETVAAEARKILETDPKDARVQLALGVALRYLNKADEAKAAYDRAESLGGDKLAEVHLNRGLLLMKLSGQCDPAIAEFRRYQASVGPGAAVNSPAPALERECAQIVAQNKAAEEAAQKLRREAEEAAKKAQAEKTKAENAQAEKAVPAAPEDPDEAR
ncbi:MAG TPA: adventurous gliding motility TPR repeat lipoprotein GltE [Anaeromyxobacteraceae bacterium]|nr:adventurous gliding motility TPR repeat lipoprotein GltE [Anaeromyxobacteraceae bacterium]